MTVAVALVVGNKCRVAGSINCRSNIFQATNPYNFNQSGAPPEYLGVVLSAQWVLFEKGPGYSGTRQGSPNMKILLIILLSPFALLASTFDAGAREASACAVVGAESIPFQRASRQNDPGYRTIETASYKGVTFYLKAGHGVARLEAVVLGKLVASTFYSYGRDPKETDSLRLSVRALNGKQVEAQCFDVDSHLP